MKIFDPDGPLMTALSKLADVVICNIMFCIFCLPVFTIGASLTALFSSMQAIVDDREEGLIFREFWNGFRKNFKRSCGLELFCAVIIGFLAGYYKIVSMLSGSAASVYRVTFYVLAIVFLFGFMYLFPMQARYHDTVKHTIRNAWLLSVAALPWTVLSIAVTAALVYVTLFMNPNAANIAYFLWPVCGFGVVAYLNSFFFRNAFRKLEGKQEKQTSARVKGSVFVDEQHRDDLTGDAGGYYSDPDWNRRDISPSKPVEKKSRRRRRK